MPGDRPWAARTAGRPAASTSACKRETCSAPAPRRPASRTPALMSAPPSAAQEREPVRGEHARRRHGAHELRPVERRPSWRRWPRAESAPRRLKVSHRDAECQPEAGQRARPESEGRHPWFHSCSSAPGVWRHAMLLFVCGRRGAPLLVLPCCMRHRRRLPPPRCRFLRAPSRLIDLSRTRRRRRSASSAPCVPAAEGVVDGEQLQLRKLLRDAVGRDLRSRGR